MWPSRCATGRRGNPCPSCRDLLLCGMPCPGATNLPCRTLPPGQTSSNTACLSAMPRGILLPANTSISTICKLICPGRRSIPTTTGNVPCRQLREELSGGSCARTDRQASATKSGFCLPWVVLMTLPHDWPRTIRTCWRAHLYRAFTPFPILTDAARAGRIMPRRGICWRPWPITPTRGLS